MTGAASLPRFGLYYPYINFRDDAWIKIAALYWPKMARVVPPGYPTHNTNAVQALIDGLDWAIDIAPDAVRSKVAPTFEALVTDLGEDAAEWMPGNRFNSDPTLTDARVSPAWGSGAGEGILWGQRMDGRIAGIHATELDPALRERLVRGGYASVAIGHGYAVWGAEGIARLKHEHGPQLDHPSDFREDEWLVMHRDLVWIYKCLLSETLAERNRLTLATDQIGAHAATSGLTATQLALGGVAGQSVPADLATTFGLIAIKTAIPKGLAAVPIEKIIEIRQKFGHQFDAWRTYVDAVGADLAEQLKDVESPIVLRRYLEEAARRYAQAPVDQLRAGLVSVGVDAADAALNMKFETPAALAAAGLATGNPLAIAAGAAVGVVELRRNTAAKARAQLASPSTYLLTVRERLAPQTWVQRIMATMRAAAGLRG